MKKETFARIMAAALTVSVGFQPLMVHAQNEVFVSGENAAVYDIGADSADDLFSSDSDIVIDGEDLEVYEDISESEMTEQFSSGAIGQIADDAGFSDGTAVIPETEEDVPVVGAGDSIAEAISTTLGNTYSGNITESNKADFYSFTLKTSGKIEISSVARIPQVEYALYDSTGKSLWNYFYTANSSGQSSISKSFDLTSGTYYLGIEQSAKKTGSYDFKISFSSSDESFAETGTGNNNTIAEADEISISSTYKGQIAFNDKKDFYKFTLASSGRITLSSIAVIEKLYYRIYNSTGKILWDSYNTSGTSGQISIDNTIDLTKGIYYLGVEQSSNSTGNYSFNLSFSDAGESFTETGSGNNNTIADANAIDAGTAYKGQIAKNDTADFYKLTLDASGEYTLTSTATVSRLYYRLYDSTGNRLWNKSFSAGSSGNITVNETINLSAGIYYLGIEQYSNYTGNYSFTLSPADVIPSNANGLIIYKNEWVFVANGQIQTQHTGLALYDGEWFYITNGKLDITVNRLVSYDGGLFVVAAGRIVREANGLYLDPNDHNWYFVAQGQVQTQHTGVAMYDGAFFYIRNGKLASDFNGTVKYDGATFKVVAGQLY